MVWLAAAVLMGMVPMTAWADEDDHGTNLVVMADFNRDGFQDRAEIRLPEKSKSKARFLTVALGQADGSYKPMAARVAVGESPQEIVVADFNRDGNPDVMVGDDDGTLTVFLGDGRGNLVKASGARLGSVVSITVADFNRDGVPDVAVSDWRSGTVTILLGTGSGAFQTGWSFPFRMAGLTPHVSAADFNGDGIPDLAVVYGDDDGYTFDVMLGTGSGTFARSEKLSVAKDPNAACVP